MGLREEARDRLDHHEERRLYEIRGDRDLVVKLQTTLRRMDATPTKLRPALGQDLSIDSEWTFSGLVADIERSNHSDDDSNPPVTVFYRVNEDSVRLYLIGPCHRCDASTPLEPELTLDTPMLDMAKADAMQIPASGHICS